LWFVLKIRFYLCLYKVNPLSRCPIYVDLVTDATDSFQNKSILLTLTSNLLIIIFAQSRGAIPIQNQNNVSQLALQSEPSPYP
jgi:hypothetical protein